LCLRAFAVHSHQFVKEGAVRDCLVRLAAAVAIGALAGCDEPVNIARVPERAPAGSRQATSPRRTTSRQPARKHEVLQGRVVSVADGDTLTILDPQTRQKTKIRLHGIDSPERTQDFYDRARQSLSQKVGDREVTVEVVELDRYGRTVGEVHLGQRWINEEQVRAGMAWHYTHYSKDARLAAAQREARDAKRGLWSMPSPVAPWDFRRTDAFRKQHEESY
jgi:endonuclease YncB( thermonuclease family)